MGSSEPVKNHQKPVVPQPTASSSVTQQPSATSSLEENILLDFGMTASVSGAAAACTQSVKASKEDMMMKDDLPILG